MGPEIFLVAVVILGCFAAFDLIVGVSNDAVNFLNSSIGSRVAPRKVIMIIASLGILAGVTFSSGMMEVARKGIFHPQLFTMPEIITIFLAVMITDIILLDLFNTFGLPTSTTVSIVFELLGAAVVVSLIKIWKTTGNAVDLASYINTAKAMLIIFGILMSVVIAFACGAVVQFGTRLLFGFDYTRRLPRYGALWGGVAMSLITYFILVKGAKGASFITEESAQWIKENSWTLLCCIFVVSAIALQGLLKLGVNILKPVVLVGTFALAMAFAANDLVNFIGVPLAGLHAYEAALATSEPLTATMDALGQKVPTETVLLLLAGAIMVVTLWVSRKARSVTETEVSLGQQEEGQERFESSFLSRTIVRMVIAASDTVKRAVPPSVRAATARRLDPSRYSAVTDADNRPAFDLVRASVNLMVASAVVSYATAKKLPLSTTYVTFMVAMGTSFSDQAWGRESAVYRVTGVLTVIGGWFMTAFMAFMLSGVFALLIYFTGVYGVIALLAVVALTLWKTHHAHRARRKDVEDARVFNLKKITDAPKAIATTFEHMSTLVGEIRTSLDATFTALFAQNEYGLRQEKKKIRKVQVWTNIIVANVFKAMRLLQRSDRQLSHRYAQTVRRLQKLADGHRDLVLRSHVHVSNHHKGLLDVQVEELEEVTRLLLDILAEVESALGNSHPVDRAAVAEKDRVLRELARRLNSRQVARVLDDTSKTRLTILYYAVVGNAMMLSKQIVELLGLFEESFGSVRTSRDFDVD